MDENSILQTIRHMLGGIVDDESYFDLDLKVIINSAFAKLWQLGVGPSTPFRIEDESTGWDEFECDDMEMVKESIFLYVKNIFDPPSNSSVLQAYKDRAFEDDFRMNIMAEELRDGKSID